MKIVSIRRNVAISQVSSEDSIFFCLFHKIVSAGSSKEKGRRCLLFDSLKKTKEPSMKEIHDASMHSVGAFFRRNRSKKYVWKGRKTNGQV